MFVTLRPKGQITIPKRARTSLGLRVGDPLVIQVDGNRLLVRKLSEAGAGDGPDAGAERSPPPGDPPTPLLTELRTLRDVLRQIEPHRERILSHWETDAFARSHAMLHVRRAAEIAARIPRESRATASMIHWAGVDALPPDADSESTRRWIERELAVVQLTVEGALRALGGGHVHG